MSDRAAVRPVPWIVLLAMSLPLGCASEVTSAGAASCPGSDAGAPLDLSDARSAAFIGDHLHLQASVGGVDRYLVLGIDAKGEAYLEATPDALLGRADLAPLAASLHARVEVATGGAARVDVVDTADPAAPAIVASLALDGAIEAPAVFSAADGHAYFCMRPPGEDAHQLFSVDLSVPTAPGEPQRIESFLCNIYELDDQGARFAARGATWLSWNLPTGTFAQSANVYAVTPSSAAHVVDYGYNQTGIHHYGNVVSAATNGVRAVFDPENESQFLLADQLSGPNGDFAWAVFSIKGPKRLLGVADTTVYLTTKDRVRAYDISDIQHPALLPYEASVALGADPPRLLATSDRFLAVASAGGDLFLVPRDHPGTIAPLQVHPETAPGATCGP
jgi:hypothetical protein